MAGREKGLCDQIFALPPGWEALPMENCPGPARSESPSGFSSQSRRWQRLPDPLCQLGRTAGTRGQAQRRPQPSSSLVPSDKNLFWAEQSVATNQLLPRFLDVALEGRPMGREPHSSGGWEMFSSVCGWADVGMVPSCPQQGDTWERKQNRNLSR